MHAIFKILPWRGKNAYRQAFAVLMLLGGAAASAFAQGAPADPQPSTAASTPRDQSPFSGYMDFHFNKPRDGNAVLDFHRFVLLFGHSFSDRISFWSELELEHALVEGLEEKGELELEQAYLDFRLRPELNIRAGMILAPMGIINERHEPPSFQGVERPFVDTFIIPSTWFDAGAGVFGQIGGVVRYKAYVMAPLDATEFSAEEGIRGGRQQGFESVVESVAYTGRVEYVGRPGLTVGASIFTGKSGFNIPRVDPRTTVFDVDARYDYERLEVRGEAAGVRVSRAGELNQALQRATGVNPNIARAMRGGYIEGAVQTLPRRLTHELAAFLRYENFDTQFRMPDGYTPLPEFDRSAWIVGATYYPDPDIAVKFDVSVQRNRSEVIRAPRSLNIGLGWWF